MTPSRLHTAMSVLTLLAFLLVATTVTADAQKKKAKAPPKPKQEQVQEQEQEQVKVKEKEQAETEAEPAQQAAQAAPTTNTFKELLKQQVGRKTNMGVLKKIAGDYMIFEDDNVTTMYPLYSVQSIRLVKDDEATPARVEIHVFSRD